MNVQSFLNGLDKGFNKKQGRSSDEESKSLIDRVFLNFSGNHGKYQLMIIPPELDVETPFVTLHNTREISIPRKVTNADGTVSVTNSWVKILPASAYRRMDLSGRSAVSSLTNEDQLLLEQVQKTFDSLFRELGGFEKDMKDRKTADRMRRRNYVLFYAHCLNFWEMGDSRNSKRQNFSSLFVCTTDKLVQSVLENCNSTTLVEGGDVEWVNQVYNRQSTGRTGFMMLGISMPAGQVGYSISTEHIHGKPQVSNIEIDPAVISEMYDPVKDFLGWQASRDVEDLKENRLFNRRLMRETLSYLSAQLQAVLNSKANFQNPEAAYDQVKNLVIDGGLEALGNSTTLDPMLRDSLNANVSQAPNMPTITPDTVNMAAPPAAHIDPIAHPYVGEKPNESSSSSGSGAFYQPPVWGQ